MYHGNKRRELDSFLFNHLQFYNIFVLFSYCADKLLASMCTDLCKHRSVACIHENMCYIHRHMNTFTDIQTHKHRHACTHPTNEDGNLAVVLLSSTPVSLPPAVRKSKKFEVLSFILSRCWTVPDNQTQSHFSPSSQSLCSPLQSTPPLFSLPPPVFC